MSSEIGEAAVGRAGGCGARSRDIAVIGMAVRLPEADDVPQFLANLRTGRDSVREISTERRARTGLPLDGPYQLCGFIEDIDSFDHAFFGISKGEAQNMAPEHRLLLQVAYQAVENAGYAASALRGLRASVYVGDTRLEYDRLAETIEPTMVMGTHVSAMAGRVSRFLELRGTSAMVDSACSSSLLAVHHAVNDLLLGDAELAMVCGANLSLLADHKTGEPDIGIRSADGKARAFSAEASGTGSGEAVAAVVLKPLDAALRDGDIVHAVIKGIAANNGAGRSSSLTAPDAGAQAEVIERAWEKAGIDPTTISYLEAHGTGTRLGDPIEIEAIDLAFRRVTEQRHFVALSTVKSNLGHTWSASGLVGLIKAVLALRNRELFPSLHCVNPNPLIDFADSAVVVTRELTPWEPSCGVRRAGVSSFGVMGTNVHAVLEEAPTLRDATPTASFAGAHWFPVSAKSVAALESNLAELKRWIDARPGLRPQDVQHTLVRGREHHPYRLGLRAGSLDELSAALSAARFPPGFPPRIADPGKADGAGVAVALVVSGRCFASPELTRALRREHPRFDLLYARCESAAAAGDLGARADGFAFRYAFQGLLRHFGLTFRLVVAEGAGRQVLDAADGRTELGAALHRSHREAATEPTDLDARVDRLIRRVTGLGEPVLFVEAGPLSTVSRALAERGGPGYAVVAPLDAADGLAGFLSDLYTGGANWSWDTTAGDGRRVELPSYRFERIRCWLANAKVRSPGGTPPVPKAPSAVAVGGSVGAIEAVAQVWKDVLGLETVDLDVSFFDLGGDSISGMQVVNRLQTLLDLELDDYAIFDCETPRKLARYVEESGSADRAVVAEPPASSDATTKTAPASLTSRASLASLTSPASPGPLGIWLAAQFEGGSVAFNLTRCLRLTGTVDADALRRALDAVTDRHEALRASFTFADGELTQRIAPARGFGAPLDRVSVDEARPDEAAITEAAREFAARPFDLARGPLIRGRLSTYLGNEHILTLCTHHIVADGWSLELLIRDLGAFYAGFARGVPVALPPIGATYPDHCAWERERGEKGRASAAEYWLDRFADVPAAIALPIRSGVGGAAFAGAYRNYALPEELWSRVRAFAKAQGGTAFTCVVGAFAALLSRHTEHGELVLGTSVHGRSREAAEQLIGMFVRTLPLRLKVDDNDDFRELFGQVRSVFGDAVRNLDYPYEELVPELRRRGLAHAPHLFDVLIEFEQFAGSGQSAPSPMAGPELRVAPVEVTLGTSVIPLDIMLAEQGGGLEAAIRFDTRLFDEPTIDRLWESFGGFLETVLDRPADPLRELPHLTEPEQARVRALGHHEFGFDPAFRIHHAIERHARSTPGRVCLSCGADERTYAQLNARANRLARYFVEDLAVRPGEIVALVMDRSIPTVESILALWKCGAAYLPIDPDYPPAYIRSMLESSRVRVLAVDPTRVSPELRAHIAGSHRVVELTAATAEDRSAADLDVPTDDRGVAYVIYTSGSTGVPKGVLVEHPGMLNHLHAKIVDLSLSERSVVVQNASNSFDISVWQMFAAPFVGGRTVIHEAALQLDPIRFGDRLDADAITVLEVVPSYLDTMLDAWERGGRRFALRSMEFLMVTGEAVLPRVVNRWLARYPAIPVVNAYGPTEASDDVTHHVMTDPVETDTVPLGRPIHNTLVYVLDEHLRVCPQGVKGEVYVSGIGVSRGYLNAPEQTARVFGADPFRPERRMYRTGDAGRWSPEGTLEYLGRTDSQVKVRGFRIDLGEIERRVDACPGVKAAAVVVAGDAKDRLRAYVVPEPGGSVSECRARLHRELPHHMVPADFVELDRLPLTANGKVDRNALRRIGVPRPRGTTVPQPRSETERVLTRIWEEVLGVDGIGGNDRFLEVGGNSLRAIQVLSRVRSRLGVELGLEDLFAQPTLASLAGLLSNADVRADDPIASLGAAGVYDLALTQNLLLEAERSYAHRDAFNRNDLYELRGKVDAGLVERSFALVLERHESLRTTFAEVDGKRVQIVHEPGSLALPFGVHDLTREPVGAASEFARSRIRTPFEVATEPPVRADLLRTGADDWSLLVSMHQLMSDGRSVDVLVDDWLTCYDALSQGGGAALPAPITQFKDTARRRNERLTSERVREHRAFWSDTLANASSVVPLATDHPRPAVTAFSAECLRFPLSPDLARLAAAHEVTEFVVAESAVSLLLLAETGARDVTIGTYTRGRNRLDFEDQIGFYINTVPLRLRLLADDDVSSVLTRAQAEVLRAFRHEEYPYEWIMRDLGWRRGPDRSPIFDVMIAMDLAEAVEADGRGAVDRHLIAFEPRVLPRRSKEADLLFVFDRAANGGRELAVTYNTEIFAPDRVREFALRLGRVVEAMADDRSVVEILKI